MSGERLRWPPVLREWLIGAGLDDKTIRLYVEKVAQAERWCRANRRQLPQLSAADTRAMAEEIWPATYSTRRQARTALKHFWECYGRKGAPYKAVPMPQKPRPRNRALPREDARLIAKVAAGWYPKGTAVLAGLHLGLRASEIGAMRWDRFDHDLAWYTVTGKGGVTATIPVNTPMRDELRPLWWAAGEGAVYLFPGGRGRPHITPAAVWKWTREVAEAAGVERTVTPHMLRHTAITEVNDRTGDLRVAQEFARHARPETTALYTRVEAERLAAAAERIDYLSEALDH